MRRKRGDIQTTGKREKMGLGKRRKRKGKSVHKNKMDEKGIEGTRGATIMYGILHIKGFDSFLVKFPSKKRKRLT